MTAWKDSRPGVGWVGLNQSQEVCPKHHKFRIISLLSVEGKISFSIVVHWLADFLLNNHYINALVQKGGIPGVPRCLEHRGAVTQLRRDFKENRGGLTNVVRPGKCI